MMTRGGYVQLMAPGLHSIWTQWNKTKQPEPEFPLVFNVETSSRAFEDELEMAGLGPAVLKGEGESVTYQDPVQGGTVRYNMLSYALGVRISWEMHDDDQYGIVKTIPPILARSHHFVREQVTWNIINNGFTTTTTTDGLSLFNNNHPLLGGAVNPLPIPTASLGSSGSGFYPNRPSTDVALSFSAVQTMVGHFNRLIDGLGLPVALRPKYLAVPAEKQWLAAEILGSAQKPGTANNDINALLKYDLKMFVGTYLTSASAWFAFADKDQTTLKHFTRKKMDVDYADDFDTRSLKVVAFERFAAGATSWMGTWGSTPS